MCFQKSSALSKQRLLSEELENQNHSQRVKLALSNPCRGSQKLLSHPCEDTGTVRNSISKPDGRINNKSLSPSMVWLSSPSGMGIQGKGICPNGFSKGPVLCFHVSGCQRLPFTSARTLARAISSLGPLTLELKAARGLGGRTLAV